MGYHFSIDVAATGRKLREQRIACGLTRMDVFRLCGRFTSECLSRWENGTALPRLQDMAVLAAMYGVTVDDLVVPLEPGSPSTIRTYPLRGRRAEHVRDMPASYRSPEAVRRRSDFVAPVLDPDETGRQLALLRISCGYSTSEVCDAIGIKSASQYRSWESGDTLPSLDRLLVLSRLFETRIADILAMRQPQEGADAGNEKGSSRRG